MKTKTLIITITLLLSSIILYQQTQIQQLQQTIQNINSDHIVQQWLIEHYGVSSIDELISQKLKEYGIQYTGNPFTTALYPGQIQAENITGMHWYTYKDGSLLNRTDVIQYPEQSASYIIFGEDTNNDGVLDIIYAKNCSSGQIEFSGADPVEVLQDVVDAFPSYPVAPRGGRIIFKRTSPNTFYDFNGATINVIDKEISFEGEDVTGVYFRNVKFNYSFTTSNSGKPQTIFKNLRFERTLDGFTDEAIFLNRVAFKKIENCFFQHYDKSVVIQAKSGEWGYGIRFDNCVFDTNRSTTSVFIELVGEPGVNYPQNIRFDNCKFVAWSGSPAERVPVAVYANPGMMTPIVFLSSWFLNLHAALKIGSYGVRGLNMLGCYFEHMDSVITTDDEVTPTWRSVRDVVIDGCKFDDCDYIFNYMWVHGRVQPIQAGTHITNPISPGNPPVEWTQVFAKIPNGTALTAGVNLFTFNNSGRIRPTEVAGAGDRPVRVDVYSDGGIGVPFTVLAYWRWDGTIGVRVIVSANVTLTSDLLMKITLFP